MKGNISKSQYADSLLADKLTFGGAGYGSGSGLTVSDDIDNGIYVVSTDKEIWDGDEAPIAPIPINSFIELEDNKYFVTFSREYDYEIGVFAASNANFGVCLVDNTISSYEDIEHWISNLSIDYYGDNLIECTITVSTPFAEGERYKIGFLSNDNGKLPRGTVILRKHVCGFFADIVISKGAN